jgi:hypothetical protein
MKEALKTLYRSNINPMREVIIDSLEYLIGFEPNISLKFKDFEELRIEVKHIVMTENLLIKRNKYDE